ncbi:MAG: hypothetical protein LBF22_05145, partial [Deltaproteobacteria bacterium]|nr:hypothetical protein [Deltaproteobacteria bacterium]
HDSGNLGPILSGISDGRRLYVFRHSQKEKHLLSNVSPSSLFKWSAWGEDMTARVNEIQYALT